MNDVCNALKKQALILSAWNEENKENIDQVRKNALAITVIARALDDCAPRDWGKGNHE